MAATGGLGVVDIRLFLRYLKFDKKSRRVCSQNFKGWSKFEMSAIRYFRALK
jgi:hypothetical protein